MTPEEFVDEILTPAFEDEGRVVTIGPALVLDPDADGVEVELDDGSTWFVSAKRVDA